MLSKSVCEAIALCASKFNFSESEGCMYVTSMKGSSSSRVGRPLKKKNVLELSGEDIFASLVMSSSTFSNNVEEDDVNRNNVEEDDVNRNNVEPKNTMNKKKL